MKNLANKKKVIVTLFEHTHTHLPTLLNNSDAKPEKVVVRPDPIFQGTLKDFLKENYYFDKDEMKKIDQLEIHDLAFLSSGQSWMVLRRDR